MKKLSNYFYKKASLLTVTIATLAMFAYAYFGMAGNSDCFAIGQSGDTTSLGLSFGYSYETVLGFFADRTNASIACYKVFLMIWDNIFPLGYGIMYIFWISFIWKKLSFKNKGIKLINLYPILMILADWIENIQIVDMANYFMDNQTLLESQASLGSTISIIKWCGSSICYLIIIVGIIMRIRLFYVKSKLST